MMGSPGSGSPGSCHRRHPGEGACRSHLHQGLDFDNFAQVRPLLFGKKEIDTNVNTKAFQKDTENLAKQFAKKSRNEDPSWTHR